MRRADTKARLKWKEEQGRLEKAGERAAEILDAVGLVAAPIDPLKVASCEGDLLVVIGDDFRDRFDGQLEYHRKHDRFLLLYNTKYDRGFLPGELAPRTRFSIGHELGHFYLDHHHTHLRGGGRPHGSRSGFVSDLTIEREADAFAAGLLMPSKLLRPLVNEYELNPDRVELIASTFKTSWVSTAIRCVQLTDFPCAIVGIREGRMAWRFQAESLVKARCYPRPRDQRLSPRVREKWTEFLSERLRNPATAEGTVGEWFETYDKDDLALLPVSEFYMPIPIMETLMILLVVGEDDLFPDDED